MKRLLLLLLLAVPLSAAEIPEITTVLLVRHAEKVSTDPAAKDPELTEAGRMRANALARMLADAGVDAIYATPFHRTRQTAAPLAKALGLEAIELPTGASYAADVVARIRKQPAGSTIVVVGHSNSTQHVMRELGLADVPVIDESDYDNLFVVTLVDGRAPRLLRLRYGI